jgi:hypothetical protein
MVVTPAGIPLHDKHSHKRNTDNPAVRTRTLYQYIQLYTKRNSFAPGTEFYFILPNVILPVSPPSIFLIWFRTRIIVNNVLFILVHFQRDIL